MSRTKGARDRVGQDIKHNIMEVYELLGGTHGMYEWARENPGAFYLGIYSKLLPRNIEAKVHVASLEALVAGSSETTELSTQGSNIISITSRDDES